MPRLRTDNPGKAPIGSTPIKKILYSVEDTAAALSMGRTTIFALIVEGQIKSVKIGKRRLVAASEIEAYVERLINPA